MTKQDIIEMLEEIMDLDEGELDETTELSEVDKWDSIAKLALMAQAKKLYGKNLSTDEIRHFEVVEDICNTLI